MRIVIAIFVGLLATQVAIYITTIYLHRGLAHRALSVGSRTTMAFRAVIWVLTGMRPREWAAVHRSHHAHLDTERDPHSPVVQGFWRVQLGNAGLYHRAARDGLTVERYARDLPADRWDRMLFDRGQLGVGITAVFFVATFGIVAGLLGAATHFVGYLMMGGAVNAIGHTIGRRPYANSGTNSQGLALITGGEGFHNNHHAFPTSAILARGRRQLDPAWKVIQLLVKLKAVEIRKVDLRVDDLSTSTGSTSSTALAS